MLLRTSDADVVGTFVRGKLAHQTEHLSGRVTVVNIGDSGLDVAAPQTNGHGATGLSYPNKTPDVPLERPATASGCEFDSLEDAIKDIGPCGARDEASRSRRAQRRPRWMTVRA